MAKGPLERGKDRHALGDSIEEPEGRPGYRRDRGRAETSDMPKEDP
jgi:hypothetical protein